MESLLNFWFPNDNFNKFWFDKSKDLLIENYYFGKLINVENCEINYKILTDEEILEKIILLDQISRNIYRQNPEKIKINDKKALLLSLYFFENRDWRDTKFNHLIFYLMPLRHTFNKEYYNKIFEIINLSKKKYDDEVLFKKIL